MRRLLVFLCVMGFVTVCGRFLLEHQSTVAQAANPSDAAPLNIAAPHAAVIPQDALRLRIIANSDSTRDQNLKLQVRDAIVTETASLLTGVHTSQAAREVLIAHLPTLEETARHIVQQHGFPYGVAATVAKVPFPTKIYGNQVYPAGEYEALRITLGRGLGQNWWCVLFPPLCFIDIADGDAVPNTGGFPDLPPLETIQVAGQDGTTQQVAVRLASVDYGEELWKGVQNLFQR